MLKLARVLNLDEQAVDRLLGAANHPPLDQLRRRFPGEQTVLEGWRTSSTANPGSTIDPGQRKPHPSPAPGPRRVAGNVPLPWYERIEERINALALRVGGSGTRNAGGAIIAFALLIIFHPLVFFGLGYFVPQSSRLQWDSDQLACLTLASCGLLMPATFALVDPASNAAFRGVSSWRVHASLLMGAGLGYVAVAGTLLFSLAGLAALFGLAGVGVAEFVWQPLLRVLWAALLTAAFVFGCYWGVRRSMVNWTALDGQLAFSGRNWLIMLMVPLMAGPFVGFFLYEFRDELRSIWLGPLLGLAILIVSWRYYPKVEG